MLSTQGSEYLTGFWKLLWGHAKTDSNFQVTKIAIFGIISPFPEFSRTLCRNAKKRFSAFTLLHQSKYSRKYFGTKTKEVLRNLWGKFLGRHKLLFWKPSRNLKFWICGDVISKHFWFRPKLCHSSKVKSIENLW